MIRSAGFITLALASTVNANQADPASEVRSLRQSIGDATFRSLFTSTPNRRLADDIVFADQGDSWACSSDEKSSETCCGAVPKFFELFDQDGVCAPYFGVAAATLGMEEEDLPWSTPIPKTVSEITGALNPYCASACKTEVDKFISTYKSRNPAKRLCPQVLDGLWRLESMCTTDQSNTFCLPTYTMVSAAFSGDARALEDLGSSGLNTLCSSSCVRTLQDAGVSAASKMKAAAKDAKGDAKELLDYSFHRASAFTRMVDAVCTRDPNTDEFCSLSTGLFTRSEAPVGGAVVFQPNPENSTTTTPVESNVSAPTEETNATFPSADVNSTVTPVANTTNARRLYDSSQEDDSRDSDSLSTLFTPTLRPGFACTFCGQVVMNAMVDLAEIYGNELPNESGALSTARVRALLKNGCGVHEGKSCLQLFSYSNRVSEAYDPTLGSAMSSFGSCMNDVLDGFQKCSDECETALERMADTYGCCLGPVLEMSHELGSFGNAPVSAEDLARRAQETCDVQVSECRAELERFVATKLPAVSHKWASSNDKNKVMLYDALALDLAAIAGQGQRAQLFRPHSLVKAQDDNTVVVMGVVALSNSSSLDVVATIKRETAADRASYPHVSALLEMYPEARAGNFTGSIDAEDSSPEYAPADREYEDAATRSTATTVAVLASAAALFYAAF